MVVKRRSVSKRKTNSKRKPVKRSVSKRKTNSKRKVVKRSVSKRKIKGGRSMSPQEAIEYKKMKDFTSITIRIIDGDNNELSYKLDQAQYKDFLNHRSLPDEGYLLYKTDATFKPVLKSEFIKKNIKIDKRPRNISLGNGLISRKNGKNNKLMKNSLIQEGNIENSENISVFPFSSIDEYIFYLILEFSKVEKLLVPQTYVKVLGIVAKKAVAQNKSNP